jgi:hypothetical protein
VTPRGVTPTRTRARRKKKKKNKNFARKKKISKKILPLPIHPKEE